MNKRDLEKEFEAKYKDYGRLLYRTAYLYVGNSADAEDILQEVFMKYLSGKYRFKNADHERAWFIRVTQNKALDFLKRKGRKNVSLDEINEPAYEKDTYSADVLRQVMALPEKYKSAVMLYYYDGCSVEEIAAILKISKSAVKMRLKRSREILKTELEDYA